MLKAALRRRPVYRDWNLLQLAALVLALDQLTKFVVRETLAWHQSWPFAGFFRFTHVHNTGSAFGLFQDQNLVLLFVSVIGIIVLGFIYGSQDRPGLLMRASISLMLGGAAGNLLDRVILGHVTDFIDIGPWPVFNLADSAIVTGLFLMGWLLLTRRDSLATAADDTRAAPTDCPVCNGLMIALPNGARCADCGARERILPHRDQFH
jgi:signal peptidase II